MRAAIAVLLLAVGAQVRAQAVPAAPLRLDSGRVTVVYYPSDDRLAHTVASFVARTDSFPGLPRPRQRILLAIAPDRTRFRQWVGESVPEWGAAVAFPQSNRIVLQGSGAGADAGDPLLTLRHELAHLALHEFMDDLPPRWFDEGYAGVAAHEWRREDMLATNLGLAWRGMPTLDQLEQQFEGGTTSAQEAYALAYRAVSDLAELGGDRGLEPLFASWKQTGSLERAIRLTYGITLTDFESRWRSRTKRRYGGLALVGNLAIAGTIVALLVLPLYIMRRRRDRQRLAAMVVADTRADAEADALTQLLDATSNNTGDGPGTSQPS